MARGSSVWETISALIYATAVAVAVTPAAHAASIAASTVTGAPGQQVTFTVTLTTAGQAVGGTQNDISFDGINTPIAAGLRCSTTHAQHCNGDSDCPFGESCVPAPDCDVNPSISVDKNGTGFGLQPPGCTGSACTDLRALILSTHNTNPIPDGVLYTCTVNISPTAAAGSYAISISGVVLVDPSGSELPATASDGAIVVQLMVPSPTPTATLVVASATPTPTVDLSGDWEISTSCGFLSSTFPRVSVAQIDNQLSGSSSGPAPCTASCWSGTCGPATLEENLSGSISGNFVDFDLVLRTTFAFTCPTCTGQETGTIPVHFSGAFAGTAVAGSYQVGSCSFTGTGTCPTPAPGSPCTLDECTAGSFTVSITSVALPTSTATPTMTRTPTPSQTLNATPTNTCTSTNTPTRTPTSTATLTATTTNTPTPTFTPTNTPGKTFTPTFTATPTPSCGGDCNGDGEVTVDELLAMVNVALGNAAESACPAGDGNHDGQITIDEILTAVNAALNGCATIPPPRPTDTPRVTPTNTLASTPTPPKLATNTPTVVATKTPTPVVLATSTATPSPTQSAGAASCPTGTVDCIVIEAADNIAGGSGCQLRLQLRNTTGNSVGAVIVYDGFDSSGTLMAFAAAPTLQLVPPNGTLTFTIDWSFLVGGDCSGIAACSLDSGDSMATPCM